MTTEAKSQTRKAEREFERSATQIRELNEQIVENGRRAGNVSLDLYQRTLHSVADLQEQVGTQVPFVSELARAQARFTREVADASTSAARELLR